MINVQLSIDFISLEQKAMARQVDAYQGKLSDLEQELRQVKLELEQLYDKCHAESSSWLQQRMEWTQEMKEKVGFDDCSSAHGNVV